MFGKLGRSGGAGRGSNKRPLSTHVQFHRPGETGGTRLPIGASAPPRARTGAPSVAGAMPGREETFSLEPGLIDFGSIIRLTPDLVEEIRRLEAQGGSAKIKFDANANNSTGNVVEVGGKEFRFTWSRELTDLCDIYEERRNGDDGDGLLVECGAAWRKLNVQRILDESTKNHVKMRSEEAERMLKSRKAIVLDPTNPSVKSQAKSMAAAAVEGNMRRMGWKHKKDTLFKKRKAENSHGVAAVSQARSVPKSTKSSNGNFKGISSPLPSPQQPRSRAALSTTGIVNTIRGDANPGEITPPLNMNKEEIEIVEQELFTSAARNSILDINWENGATDPSVDLRSMLISLLAQNPKGMSLKALEKVVGERIPSSVRKIDNVLKNIATFQAPGRYFLKQGFQAESSKKSFEVGSPPEHLNKQTTGAFSMSSDKVNAKNSDIETLSAPHGDGFDAFEKIDMLESTEDPLDIEEKFRDNSVVRAGSDSESLSDSDSESDSSSESDSGSQSRSRSKSRSPAASGSGSESDGSSSSKEVSDVNVDIMTSDDEKGITVQRSDAAGPKLSSPLCVLRSGGEDDSFERVQKVNDPSLTSDLLSFESMNQRVNTIADAKSLSIDKTSKLFEKLEAKTVESIDSCLQQSKFISSVDEIGFSKERNMLAENLKVLPYANSFNDRQKLLGRKSFHEQQSMMKDGSSEQPNSHEKVIKTLSKRSTNSEFFQENPENAKRMKTLNSAEGKKRGTRSLETSSYLSPGRSQHMDQKIKMSNDYQRGIREINLLDGSLLENAKPADSGNTEKIRGSPDFRGRPNLAVEQSSRNVPDSSGRKKIYTMEKSNKYSENLGRANKHQHAASGPESDTSDLKNLLVDRISTVKKRTDENTDALDKYHAKIVVESYIGDKALSASSQIGRKYTDGHILHQHNPNANGRGNFLRRELSDLELGEFREPSTDGMVEDKRQFERNGFLKNKENRATVSETNATDISLVKCDRNTVPESKRQSPNSFRVGMNGNISADVNLDLSQSQPRVVQPRSWKSSRNGAAESETITHLNKCAEYNSKNGTRIGQIVGSENEASCPNRSAATRIQKDGKRYDSLEDNKDVKGSKSQKSEGMKGSIDHAIDGLLSYNDIDSRESLGSSSDEENASYMKYNKEEQRPRGPIKDFCVYKDYVQQFKERFSHYSFLNKKLEKNRIDFLKVGDDIELARGRNMGEYYSLVENLRQMYHQRGERHKQMKKIFILLHEDLKALKQRIKDFAERRSGE